MGKRSDFKRKERDYYPTPLSAVKPLAPHISHIDSFMEPCAGDGRLIDHIFEVAPNVTSCEAACDIEPQADWITKFDAMDLDGVPCWDAFITNPPWPSRKGEPTVSIALHLSSIAPTWLLLSADFCHNRYFKTSGLSERCVKIVSVGRVSWEGNGVSGKDNAAWYLFDAKHEGHTAFIARAA
jgi:hypothetical protein